MNFWLKPKEFSLITVNLNLLKAYTKEKATELRNKTLKFNTFNLYNDIFKPVLDRADAVMTGYCRNTLLLSS